MASSTPPRIPLHLMLSEKLREQILNGQYLPGKQLPSEYQLMEQFDVSRITVRRAIANLTQQGLVIPQQGKGVFVKEQRKMNYRLRNPFIFFEEDMARQGVSSSIRNLEFKPVRASKEVRENLQLPSKTTKVYMQKKLLLLDDIPVAIDVSYILSDLGVALANDLQQQMTFPVLEKNGVAIERIEATFECIRADQESSQYLKILLGSPLLAYCYTAYTKDNQPILCGRAPSCGDRLCYSVVLTRTAIVS